MAKNGTLGVGRSCIANRRTFSIALVACAGASLGCPVDDRELDVSTQMAQPGRPGPTDVGVPGAGGTGNSMDAGLTLDAPVPDAANAGAGGTTGTSMPMVALGKPDKLDLLFMIDNSISMSDKQTILQLAVPDLMGRLINPVCLDAAGSEQPAPPVGGQCPAGQRRQFEPIADVHVGIISSSLGDVGANASCPSQGFPMYAPERVDMAHLMGSLARNTATTNAQGFLEWRAGGSVLGDFNLNLQRMVTDVGENGCGWEASLESWYRFLVDPAPYREIARVTCEGSASTATNCVQAATDANGVVLVDQILLAQRAAFLRDDSLLAIVMLTDENDCSAQLGEQNWVAFNTQDMRPMFRGSSACANDPNAKCCYSCPLVPPEGCAVDPACTADPANLNRLPADQDGQNLRCFQQRRRFGVNFLYPTDRYVNALTQPLLCTNAPDLHPNGCEPAFLVNNPLFKGSRSPSHVVLAGILGVPWQALAANRDARGQALTAPNALRFKSFQELTADGVWAQILGAPGVEWREPTESLPEVLSAPGVQPGLPQMVEGTQLPRPGVTVGNEINGRDYDTTQGAAVPAGGTPKPDDLQYACIFPLPTARDCAQLDPNVDNCDCYQGVFNRPLCEQTPGVSTPGTTQYWAKAYPGLRQLAVLQDVGVETGNSVVASICARNTTDTNRPDFGYRPAMNALIERLQVQLAGP